MGKRSLRAAVGTAAVALMVSGVVGGLALASTSAPTPRHDPVPATASLDGSTPTTVPVPTTTAAPTTTMAPATTTTTATATVAPAIGGPGGCNTYVTTNC